MRHSVTAIIAASILVTLPACVDFDDEEATVGSTRGEVVTEQGIRLQGVRLQGVRLQGVRLQGVRLQGVRLQGVRLQGVRLQGSNITGTETKCTYTYNRYLRRYVKKCYDYTRSGTDLIGATFDAQADDGTVFTLRVVDAAQDPSDPEIWLYTIEMQDPDTGAWYDICPADSAGRTSAIAVGGTWDDSGAHHASSDLFTLGCTVGVIYKCASWGYKPWQSRWVFDGTRVTSTSLAGYHQACTRMARGDYCGSGKSHTVDGTAIDIEDTLGINVNDPSWDHPLEAAWDENGALCVGFETRRLNVSDDTCVNTTYLDGYRAQSFDQGYCGANDITDVSARFPQTKIANEACVTKSCFSILFL